MGSTTNVREEPTCPNCNAEGEQNEVDPRHEDALYDCHNTNCAVDRYWAKKDL